MPSHNMGCEFQPVASSEHVACFLGFEVLLQQKNQQMLGMIAGMWTGCFQDLAGLFEKETKAHGDCKVARTLSLRQSC